MPRSYHLVINHLDRVRDRFHEGRPHFSRIPHELLAREDSPVHPQGAHEQKLVKGAD